jgi:hypothetical protein
MKISVALLRVVAGVHKASVAVSNSTKTAVGSVATYAKATQSWAESVQLNKADAMRENAVRAQQLAFSLASELEEKAQKSAREGNEQIDAIRKSVGI